ncbi:MAG: fibronectin type III domain-containing protein [Actinomycetota bacterium]
MAHLSWTTPFDGGSNIDGWNVYRGTSSGGETLQTAIDDPTATGYQDTGLTNGATYYYKVAATNSVGEGTLSNEVSLTPLAATVPEAPILTVNPGSGVVHLLWSTPFDGGSPITQYTVYRGISSGTGGLLANVGAGTTTYDDTAVVAGTTYYYTVTATNGVGEGLPSAEKSAAPPTSTATAPTSPLNLDAKRRSFGILLTWSLPASDGGSPITGYKIYRSTSTGTETFLTSVGGNTLKYQDQTTTAGIRYYYKVSAVNAVGEGPLSAEDSVRSG